MEFNLKKAFFVFVIFLFPQASRACILVESPLNKQLDVSVTVLIAASLVFLWYKLIFKKIKEHKVAMVFSLILLIMSIIFAFLLVMHLSLFNFREVKC